MTDSKMTVYIKAITILFLLDVLSNNISDLFDTAANSVMKERRIYKGFLIFTSFILKLMIGHSAVGFLFFKEYQLKHLYCFVEKQLSDIGMHQQLLSEKHVDNESDDPNFMNEEYKHPLFLRYSKNAFILSLECYRILQDIWNLALGGYVIVPAAFFYCWIFHRRELASVFRLVVGMAIPAVSYCAIEYSYLPEGISTDCKPILPLVEYFMEGNIQSQIGVSGFELPGRSNMIALQVLLSGLYGIFNGNNHWSSWVNTTALFLLPNVIVRYIPDSVMISFMDIYIPVLFVLPHLSTLSSCLAYARSNTTWSFHPLIFANRTLRILNSVAYMPVYAFTHMLREVTNAVFKDVGLSIEVSIIYCSLALLRNWYVSTEDFNRSNIFLEFFSHRHSGLVGAFLLSYGTYPIYNCITSYLDLHEEDIIDHRTLMVTLLWCGIEKLSNSELLDVNVTSTECSSIYITLTLQIFILGIMYNISNNTLCTVISDHDILLKQCIISVMLLILNSVLWVLIPLYWHVNGNWLQIIIILIISQLCLLITIALTSLLLYTGEWNQFTRNLVRTRGLIHVVGCILIFLVTLLVWRRDRSVQRFWIAQTIAIFYNVVGFSIGFTDLLSYEMWKLKTNNVNLEDTTIKVETLGSTEICSICMTEVTKAQTTSCNHSFHPECLESWFSTGNLFCPMCRTMQPGESTIIEEPLALAYFLFLHYSLALQRRMSNVYLRFIMAHTQPIERLNLVNLYIGDVPDIFNFKTIFKDFDGTTQYREDLENNIFYFLSVAVSFAPYYYLQTAEALADGDFLPEEANEFNTYLRFISHYVTFYCIL